ncbi:RHS repeat domain-containing protein, partial [Acinetobacter baumannii]
TNPDGSFLAYAYDANGNISQRSTAAGTVSYSYDKTQNLTTITDNTGKTTSSTYDDTGRLASAVTPDGITASTSYDPNGRLLQLLHSKGSQLI